MPNLKDKAMRAEANRRSKVGVVMEEFKKKKLRSGSGQRVTNPKQALAIALSEAGLRKS